MNVLFRVLSAVSCMLIALSTIPAAQASGDVSPTAQSELELQHRLLHTKIPLSGLQQYSVATKAWKPLPPATARVRVVSVWSLSCQPCIDELPLLTGLAEKWRKSPRDVQFFFVADPPNENSKEAIQAFWSKPLVPRLADRCGRNTQEKLGDLAKTEDGLPACALDLHKVEVVRGLGEDSKLPLSTGTRPLTLLVDASGTVRHVFLGSLLKRQELLENAIQRLLESTRAQASAAPSAGRAS